jgi:hypothetical protein
MTLMQTEIVPNSTPKFPFLPICVEDENGIN